MSSSDQEHRPTLVVVGGGITGLAAAWEARARARVVVVEGSATLGGKIVDGTVGGARVADGPDAFLARVPWATTLCREVGLGDDLVSPMTGSAFVWSRGALRPLPPGTALGVPTDLVALARSGVIPPLGLARAALDVVRPRTPPRGDESVAEVIERRFGRAVVDRLVAPLLGGINAGDVDRLSLRAVAPQILEAAERHRSLLLGLRAQASSPTADSPVFHSIAGGLSRLVGRLGERLGQAEVEIRTSAPATAVEVGPSGPRVVLVTGQELPADGVVVTTPAPQTAELVGLSSPAAAAELEAIRHASVAVVLLSYPRHAVGHSLEGSGLLVPAVEHRLVTAVTFWGSKWPEEVAGDQVVLRASVGRFGDDRAERLDDPSLVTGVERDLAELLGVDRAPDDVRVVRWPRSFPQYEPGHLARVHRIDERIGQDLPGVALAGAAYRGVGIPACIRAGREAATRVLDALGTAR